jgi:hypothetical protein
MQISTSIWTYLGLFSEPLMTNHLLELNDSIDRLIRTFDRRHRLYGNKEYADLLWKVSYIFSSLKKECENVVALEVRRPCPQ